MRISARKLLSHSTDELWGILSGEFTLVFDDGEILTNDKETLYSSYVWEYLRRYPTAPILKNHHVSAVLKGGRLNSSTHLELIGKVCWSVYDHASAGLSEEEALKLRYEFAEMAYRITNAMYNDLSYRLEEYVTSLDIVDFIQTFEHPSIVQAYKQLQPTSESIGQLYQTIGKTLRDKSTMGLNPLSQLFRSKLVKNDQVLQCVGVRGFVTDVNSIQFRTPVLRGYLEGLSTMYNSLTESRSAAKSLFFSKEPLQEAEYFSRRVQLVAMSVENLHYTDCGSGRYLRWRVRGRDQSGDKSGYAGDLQHLVGKYYLSDEGKLKKISAKDEHLVGQEILLRSVLHCQHPDPNGICSTCFGSLFESVPANSNIGHMCTTYMTQQSSQSVLSVKHLDSSAELDPVELTENERKYLKPGLDKTTYLLADATAGKNVKLMIKNEYAQHLTDVKSAEKVTDLALARVSLIPNVWISVDDGKSIYTEEVNTKLDDKRVASMTYDLLSYVKEFGWDVTADGFIEIDLISWDWTKPILVLPPKHFNMSDHSKEISEILESNMKKIHERNSANPEKLLIEFFDHVNDKLNVNLAILEVIWYSAMIVDANVNDYSLPKPWTKAGVGVMRRTMDQRSMAPRMAYERHQEVIQMPESFVLTNRVESPFDAVLMPREVIEAGTRTR